jgi:hypothetical protein
MPVTISADTRGGLTEAQKLRSARGEARKLKAHLTDLTGTTMQALAALDGIGARKDLPADIGKALARVANGLEVANDKARYFGLGVDWRKDRKPGRAALRDELRETGPA